MEIIEVEGKFKTLTALRDILSFSAMTKTIYCISDRTCRWLQSKQADPHKSVTALVQTYTVQHPLNHAAKVKQEENLQVWIFLKALT